MRGGSNKKSIQEHLEAGTYRPNRHGVILPSDIDALTEMKTEIYTRFHRLKGELKKIKPSNDSDTYKKLNDVQISLAKSFTMICRTPLGTENKEEADNDKNYELL